VRHRGGQSGNVEERMTEKGWLCSAALVQRRHNCGQGDNKGWQAQSAWN
jgi:hypothetical protein